MEVHENTDKMLIFFDMSVINQYHCAPMFDEPLPKQADLRKLTARGASFEARLSVDSFPRLASAVQEGNGLISVDLHCGVDDQYIPYVSGIVKCRAPVICQRCLEPVEIEFSSVVSLGVVSSEEQARQLPDAMDPLVVGENELVDLNEVVEDELLLGMPIISYHNISECTGLGSYESADKASGQIEKKNPFTVLEQLKSGKKQEE